MRILAWDIEASNLSADFGIVLCVGFKEVGKGKPTVLRLDDYPGKDIIAKERNLLKDVRAVLLDADCWLTHFGTWYDIPFINTRLLYHNLSVLPPTFAHVDTWRTAKNRMRLRNNRLVTISEFLGTRDEKNPIKAEQWLKALGGHRPSMSYIVEHCRLDVLVLEQVYKRIRPLVPLHPVDGRGKCMTCGSDHIQYRGYHRTHNKMYRRFQCNKCGSWDRETKAVSR